MMTLGPALRELFFGKDTSPLSIVQSYDNKITNFAEKFRDFISNECVALVKGEATTEPSSSYLFVNQDGGAIFTREEVDRQLVRRVVIADRYLVLPNNFVFSREIYSKCAIVGGRSTWFKAVLTRDALELGDGSAISRWAHGRRVKLSSSCEIKGRLSADEEIILEPNCVFERIHAPTIRFLSEGYETNSVRGCENETLSLMSPILLIDVDIDEAGRWLVKGDLLIPGNSYLLADIVVQGNITIGSGATIEGSIKAYGNVELDADVKIVGAIVSEKNILLGEKCRVQGPISAERCVMIKSSTVIGSMSSPTTVTANRIKAENEVVAHGTLWAKHITQSKICRQWDD